MSFVRYSIDYIRIYIHIYIPAWFQHVGRHKKENVLIINQLYLLKRIIEEEGEKEGKEEKKEEEEG